MQGQALVSLGALHELGMVDGPVLIDFAVLHDRTYWDCLHSLCTHTAFRLGAMLRGASIGKLTLR